MADQLTAGRTLAAGKLADAVEEELRPLGMPSAQLKVLVEPAVAAADTVLVRTDVAGGNGALGPTGSDRVDMSFSANAGEPLASLARVASGGELSRVLLAVKRALLLKDPVPVSIFDEVDSGVGGAIGDAIGEKLQAIAQGRQVLVISHLPQIAAKASQHLVVHKVEEGGRTHSRVRVLAPDARVEELARMLGGKEITDATRRHAEEMLAHGRAEPETAELRSGKKKRKKSA